MSTSETTQLTDDLNEFLHNYYREDIGRLAQRYPQEQRSLVIDYQDLFRFDPDLADDLRQQPGRVLDLLEEALDQYDLPAQISLSNAHVRVTNLPNEATYFPGGFSPTDEAGTFATIRGDVLVSTDTYSRVTTAAFECQRCGTLTRIPQVKGDWQEPHECSGCERQGPFDVNHDQSEFVDGETIQLQTPPEVTTGTTKTLQVFVEDDLVNQVGMGDRIAVTGTIHLQQQDSGRSKATAKFEPYLEGNHIEVEDSSQADLDIDPELKERVRDLADGEEGDPLEVAAESFHTGVHGYLTEKKALILSIVGGGTNTPDVRGKFHVLFIGDPSTAKSQLITRVNDVAVRSVAASANQSTSAGLTTTAQQGEFSDGRWTLQPGAFVKANEGVVTIDELDDMPPEDRDALSEPMANQQLNVSKAGIDATLSTKIAVVAAANPKHGRFDQFEPLTDQFVFESNLLSRFDLVFTFLDEPDEQDDRDVADHITKHRDAKIREHRGLDIPDDQQDVIAQPVDDETLRAWLTMANQQPDPVYEDDEVRKTLRDSFVTLRGANGYDNDDEVPVTFRKLSGVERIARAAAKLELSPVITKRHAETAMDLVGSSLEDYQKTKDGKFDANIAETGESKSQKERKQELVQTLQDLQSEAESGTTSADALFNVLDVYDQTTLEHDIQSLKDEGVVIEKQTGDLRYIGGYH